MQTSLVWCTCEEQNVLVMIMSKKLRRKVQEGVSAHLLGKSNIIVISMSVERSKYYL